MAEIITHGAESPLLPENVSGIPVWTTVFSSPTFPHSCNLLTTPPMNSYSPCLFDKSLHHPPPPHHPSSSSPRRTTENNVAGFFFDTSPRSVLQARLSIFPFWMGSDQISVPFLKQSSAAASKSGSEVCNLQPNRRAVCRRANPRRSRKNTTLLCIYVTRIYKNWAVFFNE